MAKDLSLESRIVAVSDVFGALHEDRPYRKGVEMGQIVSIMKAQAPRRLDAQCVDALLGVLDKQVKPLWAETPIAPLMVPPAKHPLGIREHFARLA